MMIIAVHELTHGTVFETKWMNTFFGRLFAFLGWINPEWFQASHARHHRYTLHQPDDLEVVLPMRLVLRDFFLTGFIDPLRMWRHNDSSIRTSVRHAFGHLTSEWEEIVFPDSDAGKRKAVINWARFLVIGHALIIAIGVCFHFWILPVLITFSSFYGGWLLFLCGNTQHIGLQDDVSDFRLCCRSFTANPFVEFLYWHMNYHIEHHMYAAVPCYHLKELHRLIGHELPPTPHGLAATWKEIAGILKIQEQNPDYQHIAPLPGLPSASPMESMG